MNIDWDAVKRNDLARFVIARASYGTNPDDDDPNFVRNHAACKQLGIPFAAYHFLLFSQSGVDQARHFLQRIDGYYGDLAPCVDVEELSGSGGSVADRIKILSDFNQTVETALGTSVIIYTNQNGWNSLLGGTDGFAGHRLWVSNLNDDANRPPAMPSGFGDWTIYQYSSHGSIPLTDGSTTTVDLDILKVDIAAIALKSRPPGAAATPAPAPNAASSTPTPGAAPAAAGGSSQRSTPDKTRFAKAVYDGVDKKLKLYDDAGTPIFVCPARNDTVASNAWRAGAGCPPGKYLLTAPESNDPSQPNTDDNNWRGEGRWFVPIVDIPGHDGIGIHGGGSCVTPPDSNALRPQQGWCPTENCIRLQNEDLETLVQFPLAGKPIQVVQSS